jgi:methylmalonyl-CoA mutase
LIERGISPEAALGSIGLVVDASANQVLTIAKLRALRLCHARLVEAFTAEPIPAEVHAETSWRMMTRDDVYTNILRATSAALAAGIAGADSVTILPCTVAAGLPDAFARRVARNTQTILLEESGLASVSDPGSGSGVIESLTASLAEKAWSIFRKNEAAGGLAEALRLGSFQQEIANTSQIRAERTAQRERAITGISKFPNIEETGAGVVMVRAQDTTRPTEWVEPIERLRATRFAEPFEGLRDRASDLGRTGSAPKVFLANLGHPIDFVDAAQAATNLFAVGGIAVIETEGFETPVEAAQAFSASGTPFACINGSKDMSPEVVEAAARALKERGAQRVFIMDGNASGDSIDAILHEEVDVIAVISEILSLAEANRKQAH